MAGKKDDWKKAFQKNRVAIVEGLANGDAVTDILYTDGTFTQEMLDTVTQIEETAPKNRKILDILDRRGRHSVGSLYHAFQATGNEHLADLLVDYATMIEEKENFNDPQKWPPEEKEQEKMQKHRVLTIKDIKSPLMHEYKKPDVYRMHNNTRGKVFILNNVTFHKDSRLGERAGSDHDVTNLTELFKQLHFDVETGINLSAQDMANFLVDERDKVKWETMDCVIIVLMSHGEGSVIYGTDGKAVELKDLMDIFASDQCPDLDNKPRLVFVQACREDPKDNIEVISLEMQKQKIQSADELDSVPTQEQAKSEQKVSPPKEIKHPAADFLVVYATPQGAKSYRHRDLGSWFLNAVMWTFKYHAYREELQHLLIRVNRVVAKGREEPGKGYDIKFTVSEVKSNLRKKFYFFPGVYDDPPRLINNKQDLLKNYYS